MFAYLSKKMDMPSNSNIRCLAWGTSGESEGFLAAGCENGLLKVIKIGTSKLDDGVTSRGFLAAPSNIALNQNLEGHSSHIQVIAWNNIHHKLTTSDAKGLIIVWMWYKDQWFEEMVNNRNRSTVRGLDWSRDGNKICIVYEDGGVIVGSADGNRLWGKELKDSCLTGVTWSPDSKHLLFTYNSGEIQVYDVNGSYMSKINLRPPGASVYSNEAEEDDFIEPIVAVRWYSGKQTEEDIPTLAIIWRENCLHLLKFIADTKPLIIETRMNATCADWSPNGSFIAIGGTQIPGSFSAVKVTDYDQVNIFSNFGKYLQTIRLPGTPCTAISWDPLSLRIAVGCGSHIYFANLRPNYKFAYFGSNVLAYVFTKQNGSNHLAIWDQEHLSSHEIPGKLIDLKGNEDHCAILSSNNGGHSVSILNTIGALVDNLSIASMMPFSIVLTNMYVICLAKNCILIWKFHSASSHRLTTETGLKRRERIFHIDDETPISLDDNKENQSGFSDYLRRSTKDPVSCADAVNDTLVVGRESGRIQIYSLQTGNFQTNFEISHENFPLLKIWLNMDATQIAVVDTFGHLKVCNFDQGGVRTLSKSCERKDIWNLIWAKDNPNLFCIMEKTRMYVMKNGEPEEPLISSGYLAHFKDLKVTSVLLDELMLKPEHPQAHFLFQIETRALRDTQSLIDNVTTLSDVMSYVEDNSHPCLWKILARAALNELNLSVAETAFVRCKNYAGIQLTKRIEKMPNDALRKAEVASFFGDFEKAEKFYIEGDRKDLSSEMWRLLGEWNKAVNSSNSSIKKKPSDKMVNHMNLEMGDFYAEKQEWKRALTFYSQANDPTRLMECYLMLEDYSSLDTLAGTLPPSHCLLPKIASAFASVGLCKQAVKIYLACDNKLMAIETAKNLSQWDLAMELARKTSEDTIGPVLIEYTRHLLLHGDYMKALTLLQKSDKPFAAAKLLAMMALNKLHNTADDITPIKVKKLFVLSATILSTSKAKKIARGLVPQKDPHAQLIPEKIEENAFDNCILQELRPTLEINEWLRENPWRGAEAVHYFIITSRYFYTSQFNMAVKSAIGLLNYTDILGEERVYTYVALAGCLNRSHGICSRALMFLENLNFKRYSSISSQIFAENPPKDGRNTKVECHKCNAIIPDDKAPSCPFCNFRFSYCIKTGVPLSDKRPIWTCQFCQHQADLKEVTSCQYCPLCHKQKEKDL